MSTPTATVSNSETRAITYKTDTAKPVKVSDDKLLAMRRQDAESFMQELLRQSREKVFIAVKVRAPEPDLKVPIQNRRFTPLVLNARANDFLSLLRSVGNSMYFGLYGQSEEFLKMVKSRITVEVNELTDRYSAAMKAGKFEEMDNIGKEAIALAKSIGSVLGKMYPQNTRWGKKQKSL